MNVCLIVWKFSHLKIIVPKRGKWNNDLFVLDYVIMQIFYGHNFRIMFGLLTCTNVTNLSCMYFDLNMPNSAYQYFPFRLYKNIQKQKLGEVSFGHTKLVCNYTIQVCYGTFLFRVIYLNYFSVSVLIDCPCWLWICVCELVEVCLKFKTSSIPVIVTNPIYQPTYLPTCPFTYPSSFNCIHRHFIIFAWMYRGCIV